jgi:aconitate hydratase
VSASLSESLLEAHAARPAGPPVEGHGFVRADHAVIAERAARLVLPALGRFPGARARLPLALLAADAAHPPGGLDAGGAIADVREVARALGITVVPPGLGRGEALYVDRFAAPGRLVATAGEPLAAAGALGALALECGELEMAALLAGGTLHVARGDVAHVVLRGALPPWVSGFDVVLAVAGRLAAAGMAGRIVEIGGPGVEALSMADRVAITVAAAELGWPATLFPSDEVTHRYLRARGRDSDWKRIERDPQAGPGRAIELDLEATEPQVVESRGAGEIRSLGGVTGPAIARVLIGPAALPEDLARVAALLEGGAIHPGTKLVLMAGSRERMERPEAREALATLRGAGAEVVEGGVLPALPGGAGEFGLAFGARAADLSDDRTRWHLASPECCAAALRSGRLCDPRTTSTPPRRPAPSEVEPPTPPALLAALPEAAVADAAARALAPGFPVAPPLDGPVRGVVLLKAGDHVSGDDILPWGAKLAPIAGDLFALGDYAFASLDPGFAARARVHGGGIVVCGDGLGARVRHPQVALVCVALGIRVILARSWDGDYRRALILAGVLPLRFARPADDERIAAGDELELPTLPEGLVPWQPIVVRNLTRGTQLVALHDLDPREIAIALAGGLLPFAGKLPRPAERGAA